MPPPAVAAADHHDPVVAWRRSSDTHAALLELCRSLADQVDAAGPDGPSSRLAAAYLSALKDLTRALNSERAPIQRGKLAELRGASHGQSSRIPRLP